MEDYNLILSNSAKNGRKIHKNEVFSLVLRFRPWPCAHFGLGMGSRVHTLALAWASHVHTLALAWAAVCTLWPWHGLILALAVQRWLRKKKKEKVSRNLLKFCMEAYKPILSTSAKNGRKIRKNEVFSLVLRFRPWPCAHFGLGMGSRVHTLALAWAAVCTLWPWHRQPCAHFGLGIGKPCAHFGLCMGKPCAHFGLGTG